MYVCMYVRTYVRACVRAYVCMYVCMYVCSKDWVSFLVLFLKQLLIKEITIVKKVQQAYKKEKKQDKSRLAVKQAKKGI